MTTSLLPPGIDEEIRRINAEIAARPRLEIEMHPTPFEWITAALIAVVKWLAAGAIFGGAVAGATWFLYTHPGVLAWIIGVPK